MTVPDVSNQVRIVFECSVDRLFHVTAHPVYDASRVDILCVKGREGMILIIIPGALE